MVFDAPNKGEVGKEDGLEVYEKVWGDSAFQISINLSHTLRVGDFLESLSVRQERDVELLQKLWDDLAADRTWDNESLHTTNIRTVDLEAQGLEKCTEWREKLRSEMEQVGWAEAAVKELQAALGYANFTHNSNKDELKLNFDKFSVFQEGFLQKIRTVMEIVNKMGTSTLVHIWELPILHYH